MLTAEFCLFFAEIIFAYAAESTLKVIGKVLEFGAGCDSVIRVTGGFIVYPSAYVTYILFHFVFLQFYFISSKSAAPCLHKGQM